MSKPGKGYTPPTVPADPTPLPPPALAPKAFTLPEGDLGELFRTIMIDRGLAFTTRAWRQVPEWKQADYHEAALEFLRRVGVTP